MKYIIVVFALAGVAIAQTQTPQTQTTQTKPADKKTDKKTSAAKKKSTAAPPPTVEPLVIPPEAVLNPNGTYSYKDKAGKNWIYSKTPFGISKIEDMGSAPSGFVTTPKEQLIKTIDAGDTVKFERQTPFGVTKWEKKKSEMNDEERSIFQNQHPENKQ